jgi:ABC-type multidrug transport system permease subunit
MLIPLDAMPVPLQFIARFVPTTYVADAFRMVLAGTLGINVVYDIILLFGFTVAFLLVVHHKLDWRAA